MKRVVKIIHNRLVREDSIEWQKQLKKQEKAIQEIYNNINENNEIERVNLSQLHLDKLPDLKHVKVLGEFNCSGNNLQSLEGAPQYVMGDFNCINNNLQTLEGAPQYVGGDFDCKNNNLETLEGAPQYVGMDFYCYNNNLKSLEGAPQCVSGDLLF